MLRNVTNKERLEFFCVPEPNSGCWLWTGFIKPDGYGHLRCVRTRTTVLAHRMSYEEHKGPIPEDMEIDHICRNKACINPDHLEAVTHIENLRRNPNWWGNKTMCVNGHVFDGRDARSRTCTKCKATRNKKWYDKKYRNKG